MFTHVKMLLVLLSILFRAATASDCWFEAGAPYVQLVTEIAASNPPLSRIFNVPLFRPDCQKFIPADPISADGFWAPATGIEVKFNVKGFIDEGGYIDPPGLGAVYNAFALCMEGFEERTAFDNVVCQVTVGSGQVLTLGGINADMAVLNNGDSVAIRSYRCFIDVHHDGVPTFVGVVEGTTESGKICVSAAL